VRKDKKEENPLSIVPGFATTLGRTCHDSLESRPYIKLYIHIFDNYRGTM
jgi:hypothetical protein